MSLDAEPAVVNSPCDVVGFVDVLIVGAGHAGVEVCAELRSAGFAGSVTIIGEEATLPYQRPPLSKHRLTAGNDEPPLLLRAADFYHRSDVQLISGEPVEAIDTASRTVRLAGGAEIRYGALVLATGSRHRSLNVPGFDLPGVLNLQTLDQAESFARYLPASKGLVAIGSGYIALEAAAAAVAHGVPVTVVSPSGRVLRRSTSPMVSRFVEQLHSNWGTQFLLTDGVEHVEERDGALLVRTTSGKHLEADVVVVGIGATPRIELAAAAGIDTGDGILVDEDLATSAPGVYAVGDCANFPHDGARRRLESVQNATDQAKHLAHVLTRGGHSGVERSGYRAVPWFWSNQRTLKIQIAGIVPSGGTSVLRGTAQSGSFSVFSFGCEEDGRPLLAVESLNDVRTHVAARRLLIDPMNAITPAEAADPAFDLKERGRLIADRCHPTSSTHEETKA